MRNFILSVSVILILAMQASAQIGGGAVAGMLKEKVSGEPLAFATIALHDAGMNDVKNGCMTDSTGQFRFEKVPAGTYYVEGSYVGCTPVRSDVFTLEKGQTTDIGTLYISEGEQLAEVVWKAGNRHLSQNSTVRCSMSGWI